MSDLPLIHKMYIVSNIKVYNIIELILMLKPVIDKNIKSKLNTINCLPIYCNYSYNISESEYSIYDESLTFYYDDKTVNLIDNISLDKIVDWIKDNPIKVEKITKLKLFI